MRRAWSWRRGKTAEATCHFCGTKSILVPPYGDACTARVAQTSSPVRLSSGTRARWFCSACESWNHTDAQGRIMDLYERPMWDASVNRSQLATTPSRTTSTDAGEPVFCRKCLANQTLVTNLLASYLPDDDGNGNGSQDSVADDERMRAFPSYKRSLEERYPMVCATCSARAKSIIQAKDQQIQRASLDEWLVRRHVPATPVYTPRGVWRWRCEQSWWFLAHSLGLCIPLCTNDLMVAALSCLPPGPYDPCWLRAQLYRARDVRMYSHGTWRWTVRITRTSRLTHVRLCSL